MSDQRGNTALHSVVTTNNHYLLSLLLQYKANPNLQTNDGFTPLHLASSLGYKEMVQELINYHADVNIQSQVLKNKCIRCF
jgi:ankyrin repeat protein